MKLVCISDTHLAEPELPEGDILIHSGDLTYRGRPEELLRQFEWLVNQRHKFNYIIIVPGNHDLGIEKETSLYRQEAENRGLILLNEQEVVLDGVKFYGSPITPFFHNWAFNRHVEEIKPHWDIIPDDTQVLITHGPPKNILDGVPHYTKKQIGVDNHFRPMYSKVLDHMEHVGCKSLLERILELKQLQLHVFGHIHESYGQENFFGVKFINASIMNGDYVPVNKPVVVDI